VHEKQEVVNRIEEFTVLKVNADGITEDGRPNNYKPMGRRDGKD
jgi:hypothetical protein